MRLVILFGGRSAEHEISCVTAASVLAAADPSRYELELVGITVDGAWVSAEPPAQGAARAQPPAQGAARAQPPAQGAARAQPAAGALVAEGPPVDPSAVLVPGTVVFPVLHGPFGEDGTVQGLLELAGVPYVGAGVLGSAVCMDKAMAKDVAARHGIAQVRHVALRDVDVDLDAGTLDRAAETLGFPIFVKPANLGSSVGVSRAVDAVELADAVKLALSYDEWVVLEEGVRAREIEIGLLGYGRLRVSVPGEIRPSHEFYDYDDKYADGAAELLVPAPLPPEVAAEVQRLALAAGAALRVDGMARVDFFYEEGGRGLLLNEVNTIPGFTPISMYPKMWEASGVPYPKLIDELVAAAFQRHANRATRIGRTGRT